MASQTQTRFFLQCFKAAWLSSVLHTGLGFSEMYSAESLTSVSDSYSWTYGAALYMNQERFLENGGDGVSYGMGRFSQGGNPYLFAVCVVAAIVGLWFYLAKPRVEKGAKGFNRPYKSHV